MNKNYYFISYLVLLCVFAFTYFYAQYQINIYKSKLQNLIASVDVVNQDIVSIKESIDKDSQLTQVYQEQEFKKSQDISACMLELQNQDWSGYNFNVDESIKFFDAMVESCMRRKGHWE